MFIKILLFLLYISILSINNVSANEVSKSRWLQHDSKSSIRNKMSNLTIFMGDKPCPTRYMTFNGDLSKYESTWFNKWTNLIYKRLDGYPETTIKKCTKKIYFIKSGKVIDHSVHSSNLTRGAATMLWEKNGKKLPLRIILESNIRNKKPEGVIYNENLDKICTTFSKRTFNSSKVKLTCLGLPEPIDAVAKIIDRNKGKYKAYGTGGGYKVFLTNLTLEKARIKFPKIFSE